VAAVGDLFARQEGQSGQEIGGIRAAVGFHHADQHIEAVLLPLPR
jgi:hypothetical protein